ncbi:MAG: Crp/Fnr family transcriptional regulator [Anaerolineales bacterium]|nr:Crp/Fnr family transcriptional regulator [Anaerolineae bacterium]PWB55834.1 MAG: Crp/Fnr family transcriptional regulator [Anaerolineales bacterium]
MTNSQELIKALQAIPWFQVMTEEHFEKMVGIAKVCKFEPGQVIFHEGDKEDFLYVVLEGRVAIEISVPGRGRMRILTADAMDEVGWSSVTPVVRQRTAGARAVLPSRLVAFDAAELRRLCDEDHDFGYYVMRRLSNVVAGRLMTTRLQLLDMFANPVEPQEE